MTNQLPTTTDPRTGSLLRTTILSLDTGVAAGCLVVGGWVFLTSPAARGVADGVLLTGAGVTAGLLGVVLGAMAIVTAFVTPTFVAMVGDLRDALAPFRSVATVSAAGTGTSLLGFVLVTIAPWWIDAVVIAVSLALTVWTTVGVVQLVGIIIFFAHVRGRELTTLLDAERLRARRASEHTAD